VIFEIAKILGPLCLTATDLEVKGEAYQEFLDVHFRGPWGQYFTPRNIVRAMVQMADPDESSKVLDPACGSGGFLVYTIYYCRKKMAERYGKESPLFKRLLFEFSHYNLFGIEADDRIAQTAISNMILNEDAHARVFIFDALKSWKELSQLGLTKTMFDFILTNPPLGIRESRRHILDNFELGRGFQEQLGHILFLERGLEFLKPSGFFCTIISEDVLERASSAFDFIQRNAYLRAVISLEREAFIPYGANSKTNILLLQKKAEELVSDNYVFMAEAQNVGYDKAGRAIDENDLPAIVSRWHDIWAEMRSLHSIEEGILDAKPLMFVAKRDRLTQRADVKHTYLQLLRDHLSILKKEWENKGFAVRKLGDVAKLSGEPVRTKPEQTYEFVSVHFDGSASSKGRLKTRYPELLKVRTGDIVMSRIDILDGAVAIIPPHLDNCFVSKEFFVLKVHRPVIDAIFLWLLLRSKYFLTLARGYSTGVTGRHRVKWVQLSTIDIPVPDVETQKRLVKHIKRVFSLQSKLQIELETAEQGVSSLLSF
jgi:type I restriction enzyme M protein